MRGRDFFDERYNGGRQGGQAWLWWDLGEMVKARADVEVVWTAKNGVEREENTTSCRRWTSASKPARAESRTQPANQWTCSRIEKKGADESWSGRRTMSASVGGSGAWVRDARLVGDDAETLVKRRHQAWAAESAADTRRPIVWRWPMSFAGIVSILLCLRGEDGSLHMG
jgi:hypothetical protein